LTFWFKLNTHSFDILLDGDVFSFFDSHHQGENRGLCSYFYRVRTNTGATSKFLL